MVIHSMEQRKMKCPKCNGLITTEMIIAENQWIEEIYCVNCGKRIYSDVLADLQQQFQADSRTVTA